jgi:aspartyl/asparaginyl beta-hydroxylase (cupin superfamily)
LLEALVEQQPDHLDAWLKLAAIRRASGDVDGALDAISGALRIDPLHFMALMSRARILESAGRLRQADRAYVRALAQLPDDEAVPPTMQPIIDHARRRSDGYHARVSDTWDHAIESDRSLGELERSRLARFKSNALRETRVYHSEPSHYHYPGLREREFHERSAFPWLEALEAATDAIRSECETLMAERAARAEPYIQYADDTPMRQWRTLNHSLDWTAFHLTRGSAWIGENASRCPATMDALSRIPQPQIAGRSPNAMFSLLKPRTKIPPHTGVANTRLVCHLPLIVPDGCWFRVGAERREWQEGHAFVFDDTIEHEAANDSDDPRVVLIFDVWHPDLSSAERSAVARAMEAEETEHGSPL